MWPLCENLFIILKVKKEREIILSYLSDFYIFFYCVFNYIVFCANNFLILSLSQMFYYIFLNNVLSIPFFSSLLLTTYNTLLSFNSSYLFLHKNLIASPQFSFLNIFVFHFWPKFPSFFVFFLNMHYAISLIIEWWLNVIMILDKFNYTVCK